MPMTEPSTRSEPVIEVHDGAVDLGGRPILRDVDLTISQGDVVTVLGANGSGKSTLVRSMLGLVPTSAGQVRLFGTRLGAFTDWHRIGFVPQRISATAGVPASVWEVVSSGRLSRRRLLRPMSRADRDAVARAIEAVGLGNRVKDGCSTLSGGQQQRVLIARALAGEPDVLVLDEPTAGVDLLSQHAFADALAALAARGATIVLVAHEVGPMEPLVDRTIVMRDGRVAYDGPPVSTAHEIEHHHGFHHPDLQGPATDHAPVVSSPLDRPDTQEGRT